jgi:hypothetical protein
MALTTRIQIVLDADQLAALRRNHKEAGMTIRAQIKQAIDEWIGETKSTPTHKRSKARATMKRWKIRRDADKVGR